MSLRAWARIAAALVLLAFCYVCWLLAHLGGNPTRWVRRFLWAIGRLLGLRVRIEGEPVQGAVLYVANHISWLDILALGGATGTRFIAKDEIARWAGVGKLAKLGGTVFVSRERRGETRQQADTIVTALGEPRAVTLFAEGGTGDGSCVRPFRPALFASAVEARVPVQPVAIDYGPDRMRYGWPPEASFGDEAKKMMNRAEPVPVTLRFLPPLEGLDRKALAAKAHEAISGALA